MSPCPISDRIVEVQTIHGPMKVFSDDVWTSRSLIELGEYSMCEVGTIEILLAVLRATASGPLEIVEAGAYIGDMTIPLSQMVDRVYAFEPQPEVRDLLQQNLEMNKITNVEVLPFALGPESRTVSFASAESPDSPGSRSIKLDGDIPAEMRTLDSFNIKTPFIKADIEGMEIPFLYGASRTIARQRPLLFLERDTVKPIPGQTQLHEALNLLAYQQFNMDFPMWRPNNFRSAPNTFGSTVSFMALGVPR